MENTFVGRGGGFVRITACVDGNGDGFVDLLGSDDHWTRVVAWNQAR